MSKNKATSNSKKNSEAIQEISINVRDIKVTGVITCKTIRCIDVQITQPYHNLSGGSCIPYFAIAHCSFSGKYGEDRCKEILYDLFELGDYIFKNIELLQKKIKKYDEINNKLSQEMITYEDFKKQRIVLRKRMRFKEIDNLEYQKLLLPLAKESRNLDFKIGMILNEFFDNNFPMIVPVSARDEVLNILAGKSVLSHDL